MKRETFLFVLNFRFHSNSNSLTTKTHEIKMIVHRFEMKVPRIFLVLSGEMIHWHSILSDQNKSRGTYMFELVEHGREKHVSCETLVLIKILIVWKLKPTRSQMIVHRFEMTFWPRIFLVLSGEKNLSTLITFQPIELRQKFLSGWVRNERKRFIQSHISSAFIQIWKVWWVKATASQSIVPHLGFSCICPEKRICRHSSREKFKGSILLFDQWT